MKKEEKERLEKSIAKSEEALKKNLFLPEDASTLRRMIAYDKARIERDYKEE
jgi:hypothetical protein